MDTSSVSECGTTNGAATAHVVLVPIPAQGHINPFISLANYLAASGVSVTVVLSARAHSLLSSAQGSATPDYPQNARTRPMRIEVVADGMPADPKQRMQLDNFRDSIKVIGTGVEELLEKLMQEEHPPRCLVFDNLMGWSHDVAVKFGLPCMMLGTSSASAFSIGAHIPELVARGYIPAIGEEAKERVIDFVPGLSPFCIRDLPKGLNVEDDPEKSPLVQHLRARLNNVKHADRLLVNSVYELESSVVEALRKKTGIHIDPIGPLFMINSLVSAADSSAASLLQEDHSCLTWLDEQQDASVLYISFGSLASLEDNVFEELAHGLEASGLNFLWVIRPDALADKASVHELLPEGFRERTHDRGCIISWAPQLAVLAHPSVGAFLTHCGWNSILESICNGVPMLGFPQEAEQNTNLKFIVHDWKVGLPLLQSNAHSIERFHVQCAMTAMMRGDEGKEVRKHALQWKEIAIKAAHGSSKSNLEKLVDDLKCGCLKAPGAPQT